MISDEQKLAAVLAYFEEKESTYQIANRLQRDRQYVRLWIELYRYHGIEGIIRPQGFTNYEDSFKIKVIQHLIETGDSLLQTAAKFNIPSRETIRRWKKQWMSKADKVLYQIEKECQSMPKKQPPSSDLNEKTMEELKAEIDYLRMENAYLKKLKALVQEKEAFKPKKK
ncbi:helix-turn-helix domain-containing protein [Lysinibacillus sp. FSL M8-0355]|uniref:helix-turn-helix domain-containing protein n=1 Tax=Lysinibacillus sp. FSL M8-0355 TaxID=2921719 RepID=UPI0030F6BE51